MGQLAEEVDNMGEFEFGGKLAKPSQLLQRRFFVEVEELADPIGQFYLVHLRSLFSADRREVFLDSIQEELEGGTISCGQEGFQLAKDGSLLLGQFILSGNGGRGGLTELIVRI